MIFSSQLGKLDGKTSEQAVRDIANHLRKIQEELEYRLMHLDSSNVSEIDASQTTIKTGSGDLLTRLAKDAQNYTEIRESVSGLTVKVTGYEETVSGYTSQVAEYQVAVDGYSASLQKYSEDVDGYSKETAEYKAAVNGYAAAFTKYSEDVAGYTQQTAQYAATVEGYSAKLSEYTTAVNGYTQKDAEYIAALGGYSAKISEYETAVGGYSQQVTEFNLAVGGFNTTVSNFQKDVEGYSKQVTSLTLTAEGLQTTVQNLETGQAAMLKFDAASGLVVSGNGGSVTISGSCIDFGSASDANTIEGKIASAASKASNAANAASNAAGTASGALSKANDAYDLADSAYDLANSVQIPGYIKATHIGQTHMRSPDIYGGMFYATGRGFWGEPAFYLYDGWHDPGPDVHGSLGLVGHNKVGYLSYDDNGEGTAQEAQNRVLLTSLNGTALKLKADGDMSLEAGTAKNIFVMSQPVFATRMILSSGVGYGATRPATGVQGELFFQKKS